MVATFTQFLIRCACGLHGCIAGPCMGGQGGEPARRGGPSSQALSLSPLTPACQLRVRTCRVRNIRNESALNMAATRMQVRPWHAQEGARLLGAGRALGVGARSASLHSGAAGCPCAGCHPCRLPPALSPSTCPCPPCHCPPCTSLFIKPPSPAVLVRWAGGGRPAVCRLQPGAGAAGSLVLSFLSVRFLAALASCSPLPYGGGQRVGVLRGRAWTRPCASLLQGCPLPAGALGAAHPAPHCCPSLATAVLHGAVRVGHHWWVLGEDLPLVLAGLQMPRPPLGCLA